MKELEYRSRERENIELYSFADEPRLLLGQLASNLSAAFRGRMPRGGPAPQPSGDQLEVSSGNLEQSQLSSSKVGWEALKD